jgi:hypothetical protein
VHACFFEAAHALTPFAKQNNIKHILEENNINHILEENNIVYSVCRRMFLPMN